MRGGLTSRPPITVALVIGLLVIIPFAGHSPWAREVDCSPWKTTDPTQSREFFETATVEDITQCLVAGADVHARTENGWTPLHRAARLTEIPEVVTTLVAAGADVSARTQPGETPLHKAARNTKTNAVVGVLLAAGADPHARSGVGETPLHVVRNMEPSVMVRVLVTAGADVDARDGDGETPLHSAAGTIWIIPAVKALVAGVPTCGCQRGCARREGRDTTPQGG